MDRLTREVRNALMGRVKNRNTSPEIAVRKLAHSIGLRFRIGRRDLPGSPDIVFPRHGLAVFVHGCFWHRHGACPRATTPKTRTDFWVKKFTRNIERDAAATHELESLGWRVLIVWECELKDPSDIEERLLKSTNRGA
jgi:DNA mismatch endonuclease (patch repair protein)